MINKTLFFLMILIATSSDANEHQFYVLANYNYQSGQNVGVNTGYQYYFLPNFSIQTGFNQTGELEKVLNERTLIGDFSSVYLGASLRKPFNNRINSFASAGVMYVTESNNPLLLAQESTLPYVDLGFDFFLSENIALTLKHQSQFSNQTYKDMHNVSLGVKFTFGKENKTRIKTLEPELRSEQQQPDVSIVPQVMSSLGASKELGVTTEQTQVVVELSDNEPPTLNNKWSIQIGAFKNQRNAEVFLSDFNKTTNDSFSKSSVVFFKGMYRVIIETFDTQESAKAWQKSAFHQYEINSYVLQVANKD